MRNIKIKWLLSLALLLQDFACSAQGVEKSAQEAASVSPTQFLLEQVRLGEATNKDELVKQSLYRLNMIDPNNPDVVAAGIRQALRQGNLAEAQNSWINCNNWHPNQRVTSRPKRCWR